MGVTKVCSQCRKRKSKEEFNRNKDILQSKCRLCQSVYATKYNKTARGRELGRNRHLKHKYGISLQEYEQMLEKHSHRCAICLGTEMYRKGSTLHSLSVDHSHLTGKVRGILCQACNVGLGNFREAKEFLNNAIQYLEYYANK